jgi:hypothetical protein
MTLHLTSTFQSLMSSNLPAIQSFGECPHHFSPSFFFAHVNAVKLVGLLRTTPGVRVRRNWKWASTGTRRGPDFGATNCAFHPTLRRRASSTACSAAWTACPARTSIIAGPRSAPSASRCSPSADTRYVHLFRLIFRTTVQCPTTVSSAYRIITRRIF